jgi:ketosteroid isomerase-like protein
VEADDAGVAPDSSNASRLQVARRFVASIGQRDTDQAIGFLAADVTYHVLGNYAFAGTFSNPRGVADHLANLADWSMGTFDTVSWEDWLVGDEHIAALARVRIQADARSYRGRHMFLLRFDEMDKISRITVLFESPDAAARFFGP